MPLNFEQFLEPVEEAAPNKSFEQFLEPVESAPTFEKFLEPIDEPGVHFVAPKSTDLYDAELRPQSDRTLKQFTRDSFETLRRNLAPLLGQTASQIAEDKAQMDKKPGSGEFSNLDDNELLNKVPARRLQQKGLLPLLFDFVTSAPVVGDKLGTTMIDGRERPTIPRLSAQKVEELTEGIAGPGTGLDAKGLPAKIVAGVGTGLESVATFFTSPLGIATFGLGSLPVQAQKAVAVAFGVDMARHLPDQYEQLKKAVETDDWENAARYTVEGSAALLGTVHGAKTGLSSKKTLLSRQLARELNSSGIEGVPAQLLRDPVEQRERVELPEPQMVDTPLKGEPNVSQSRPVEEVSQVKAADVELRAGETGQPAVQEAARAGQEALPQWLTEEMGRRGIPTGKVFNDVDLGNPTIRAAIENDPTLTAAQKKSLIETGSLAQPVKEAPVTYAGFQQGTARIPGYETYNLTDTISPTLVKGSTVSEAQLAREGFTVPAKVKPAEVSPIESWADKTLAESMGRTYTGIDPTILMAIGVKGYAKLERVVKQFKEWSGEMLKDFGAWVQPYLQPAWDKITMKEWRAERDKFASELFTPTEEQVATLKTGGNVIGQLPEVRRVINELTSNPDTSRVASEPTLRRLVKAVEGVDEMAVNYPTLQADPAVPRQMKSRATKDAVDQIRLLEDSAGRSEARFAERGKRVEDLQELGEKLNKVLNEKELAGAVMSEFKRAGKETYRELLAGKREEAKNLVAGTERQVKIQQEIAEGQAMQAAYRTALGKSEAVANVLDYLRRMDIDPGQFKNSTELIGAMKSKAANFVDSTFEQVVKADIDTINTVSRIVMRSELLRQRIVDLKEIEGAARPFAELQRQLRETLKTGDVNKVITQMVQGVGRTAAEKALSAKAAKLLLAKEKRLADSIMVLDKSNEAIKGILGSSEYKAMKAQVYRDAGMRDIIQTTTGYEMKLEPVVPGEPVVSIPIDTAVAPTREALLKAEDYKAKALAYLADVESPKYDAKHAAGLQHFLEHQFEPTFNPGILPESGRMLPGALSSLTRGLFSWVGNPELVPMWIKQYGAGLEFNRVAATENANSAGLQTVRRVFDEYQPRLQRAAREGMKAHGIRDAVDYKEKVLGPILASRQAFETAALKAGDDLKNGYMVKGTDMAYLNEMLNFEQAVIKRVTATTEQAYSSIAVDPVGILFKDAKGKAVYRLPLDAGPSTTGRSLSAAYQSAKEWASSSPARRKQQLSDSERVLNGYVKDATNPAFKWNYNYREALVEVWNEMSSRNRLESFDDLVGRIAERVDDAPEVVEAKLLGEFDALFNRLVKEQDAVRARKELAESQGGTSQFNTERGNQIVPSEWYDYGLITTGDFYNFQMLAVEPLAIAHLRAVKSANEFLSNKVKKLDKASLKEEDVFTLGQAVEAADKMKRYEDQLDRAMKPETIAANIASLEYPKLGRAIFDFGVGSLLAKPAIGVKNILGGSIRMWQVQQAVRQQSFLYAGVTSQAKLAQQFYQLGVASLQSSRNPVTRQIGKAVAATRNTPLVGALSRHMARQNEVIRELYRQTKEDGIIRQRDEASAMGSLLDMVERSRAVAPRAPRSLGKRLAGKAAAGLRFGSKAITRYTIQIGDDLLNNVAAREANYFRKDFENRANRFGEIREQRAIAKGIDPTDVTKVENRFADRELVDAPWLARRADTKAAALDSRTFVRDRVGVDLDAKMWDYYQRRKAAKAREVAEGVEEGTYTANERLFNEQEMRQLRLAYAERVNLATRSSRPIGTHTGILQRNLGYLLGYTGFALEELLQATTRLSTRSKLRGYGWTLPVITGMLLSSALVGTLEMQPAAQALREVFNNSASQVPTIYNAQTPAQQRDAWLAGTAAVIPLYGSVLALLSDNASSRGYNLDSQFVAVNMASDIMRTARSAWEMGDATVPLIRFAERNVFPATFLAQFLPQYSGIKEMAKDRANLVLAAKGSGLEAMVRTPGRGEPRYTELSPLLNDFSNAIGNRDQEGAVAAFNAIVQKKTEEGVADPRREALRAVRSRSPLAVFVQQPTDGQLASVLNSMPPEKAQRARETLSFFGTMTGALGGTDRTTPRSSGGGGGFSLGRTRRGSSRGRRGVRRPRASRSRVGRTRRSPRIRRSRRR